MQVSPKNLDKKDAPEEHMRSEAAIQAAAHAANALSQLAAALSSAKLPGSDAAHSNRWNSPLARCTLLIHSSPTIPE